MQSVNSRFVLLLALCVATIPANACAEKRVFHLNEAVEKDIGYAQAVRVGNTLYISGSVGEGAMPQAIAQAYDELQTTLKAHGLSFSDVVKENVYTTDLDAFIANKALRKRYYGNEFAAATWVQVQRLYLPTHVVEVELIAVFPETSKKHH
jgi:2-iminobutanoate/2-iminopropanoate deaminase